MIFFNLLSGDRVRLTALDVDDLATIARRLEELQEKKNDFAFAVRPLESRDLIGYIELDGILWPHVASGFSVAIGDRARWGQGYGYEAAQPALHRAL